MNNCKPLIATTTLTTTSQVWSTNRVGQSCLIDLCRRVAEAKLLLEAETLCIQLRREALDPLLHIHEVRGKSLAGEEVGVIMLVVCW